MARYEVNEAGVENARRLIEAGKVDDDSDWSDAQPSSEAENSYLEKNGYEPYGEWHLAVNPEASEETKSRYAFPFGDFAKLHRDGVTSAKQRAAQYEHQEIADAADRLLALLDERDR